MPDAATNATPASGDMCADAAGLSVTFTASAYPTSSRAWERTTSPSEDLGGTTSAVTEK